VSPPRVVAALVVGAFVSLSVALGPPAVLSAQSDLDAFMAKVLERRDENWKKLQQYILDERELVEVRGPSGIPVWGERRTYSWFIKDGYFIRSPLTANGVTIGEEDRRKYEESYLKRAQAKEKRGEERVREGKAEPDDPVPPEMPTSMDGLLQQTRQPQFIDTAYFLKFKFEPGKYAFVGRDTYDGRAVLRIEYYPARLFSREQDQQKKRNAEQRRDRGEDVEAQMERMMNKVSLVTLWVDPASHQIVRYVFDNVNLDFLPAAWLLRLTDLKASMTMGQPFTQSPRPDAADIWLPRDVEIYFGAMLAIGAFDVRYKLDYHDYREAATSARIKRVGGRP
jgi:hypothetical protein